MTRENPYELGDRVRVVRNGRPQPLALTVTAIRDHNPVDGGPERRAICVLDDGSWEFHWNLMEAA